MTIIFIIIITLCVHRVGFKCTYLCTLLLCFFLFHCILLAITHFGNFSSPSPILLCLRNSFSTHGRTDGWSNTASPTTPPYPYIVYLDVKISVTLLNIISLQSPNPNFQCLNNLFVSEFQRFASSLPRFKSFYLAFKIFIIITMFCTPLLARRRVGKLSLTPLLSPSSPIHGRTDGWSNTASPTTPPYPYRVYLAMSTLKCPISLCSRYFMTCTTLFYFIVLQLSYIVKFFDTLPNVTLLFRLKDIIHAQSFKCLLLCTLIADHHILTLCTTLFYFSLLKFAYRVNISDTPSRFVIITVSTHKICSVSKTFIIMHPPCGRSPPVYFLPNFLSERPSRLS